MAKKKIGDVVADGVLDTELAVVRAARQAVQAVNRNLRAAKRKVTGKAKRKVTGRKKAAKKTARGVVSKTKRTVRRTNARCEGPNARCEGSAGKPPDERRGAAGVARLFCN